MTNVFFQAEDGIRDDLVTGVQTCALPICLTDALDYFDTIPMPTNFSRDNVRAIEETLNKKYLSGCAALKEIVAVYSSNGVTIRPKVEITFILDNHQITTFVTVVDRADLQYRM